jgi:hypothetical protein
MKKQLSKQSINSSFGGFRGLLALLLFPLWGLGGWGVASAQSVTITPIGADYSNKTVTFQVSWSGAFTPVDRVWVWIDYCPVEDFTPAGTFGPARIDAVTPLDKVDHITLRGFFVTSSPAEVTVKLLDATGAFNWCAYGSGAPPQAVLVAGGGYELKGTPPFVVNGAALGADDKTFGAGTCITSLTDATGNPTSMLPAAPSITLSAGSSSQTAKENTALSALKYTTANASGASLTSGSFPDGVTGSWANNIYTISGTPTATGTFTYSVTTANSQSCTNDSKTGTVTVNAAITYTGCTTASINLGTVGFASTTTYDRNGLIISSPVTATYCNTHTYSTFDGGNTGAYNAACAKNYYSTSYGNWFSWCMVYQYANQLCKSPWRVPKSEELCLLVNGVVGNCNAIETSFDNTMGFTMNGATTNGVLAHGGELGFIWSADQTGETTATGLAYNATHTWPRGHSDKAWGFALRCVQ